MEQFLKSINENLLNLENLKKDKFKINKIAKKLSYFCKNKQSKILVCGNGGSATDSDHFVTELMIRFKKNENLCLL